MAIRLPGITHAKHILRRSNSLAKQAASNVPKGHLAIYVGQSEKKRFVVPVSFLNQSSFQELLGKAEEEFELIIQWVVSQFPAAKTTSLISLLDYMNSCNMRH